MVWGQDNEKNFKTEFYEPISDLNGVCFILAVQVLSCIR